VNILNSLFFFIYKLRRPYVNAQGARLNGPGLVSPIIKRFWICLKQGFALKKDKIGRALEISPPLRIDLLLREKRG
jgi:hypothetical protein